MFSETYKYINSFKRKYNWHIKMPFMEQFQEFEKIYIKIRFKYRPKWEY